MRAGFKGEWPGPPQKKYNSHILPSHCVPEITKSWFVFLVIIRNKKEKRIKRNEELS
jgi:hypothetical protein